LGLLLAAIGLVPACGHACGQEASGGDGIATLHVYANLEQVPTLVLSAGHLRTRINPDKLRLSLDSGPLFKPTHVRLEGDDPIALAILIDTSKPKNQYLPKLEEAVAGLARSDLQAHDRVSVYALDCGLIQSADKMEPDAAKLRLAVERAIAPAVDRAGPALGKAALFKAALGKAKPCDVSVPLWDALALVTRDLQTQPGRRVLIAITDGMDAGSRNQWPEVKRYAQITSVAVFGIVPDIDLGVMTPIQLAAHGGKIPTLDFVDKTPEPPFNILCEESGGVQMSASAKSLARQLSFATQLVRERYIVEYPRGDRDTPGFHSLDVLLPHSSAYIRPTGIAVPVADAKVLTDPNTLKADPAEAPQMGKRRVLPQQ
jgi:hypothetical protein